METENRAMWGGGDIFPVAVTKDSDVSWCFLDHITLQLSARTFVIIEINHWVSAFVLP